MVVHLQIFLVDLGPLADTKACEIFVQHVSVLRALSQNQIVEYATRVGGYIEIEVN